MLYRLDNIDYEVVIEHKRIKNLYIRVKDDSKIHVSCNYLTNKSMIKNLLDENQDSLRNMIKHVNKKNLKKDKFFYLGNSYDIIYKDTDKVYIENNYVYTKSDEMLKKWLKNEIINIFDERYVYVFNRFNEDVKSPILKIREMKTRWGVYNRVNHTITLNSKLIEYDYSKIDYVIIHELSHIIHFNHSKEFWNLVGKYCKDYKSIRKEMKD